MATDVLVFDTTLRDGEQAPGFSLRVPEKLALARRLEALGVDIIEAGFPIASTDDAESVKRIAQEVQGPIIAALARCTVADIECAGKAIAPARKGRIHTFIATSDLHLERKLRISREQCLETAVKAVTQARQFTDDVQFSAEDATRSDIPFLTQVIEAVIAAGATTINLPDTVGYSTPDEIHDYFQPIITAVRGSDDGRLQHALPRRPRPGGRQQHLGAARRGAAGGVHDQRHRRACRQRRARRDRDDHEGARRPRALHHAHRRARAVRRQPVAHRAHRRGRPGQQGHRRAQRVRARVGHPPGRDAQGPPDVRDHVARQRRRAQDDAGARQALGPARRAAEVRGARLHASASASWIRCTAR